MKTSFFCSKCKTHKITESTFTAGYGIDSKGNKVCYACCALEDRKEMTTNKRIVLYLTINAKYGLDKYGDCKITNWPGSLSFPGRFKQGKHNIAGQRVDVWFHFNGHEWHGVTYGHNTQICHCRQTKKKAV